MCPIPIPVVQLGLAVLPLFFSSGLCICEDGDRFRDCSFPCRQLHGSRHCCAFRIEGLLIVSQVGLDA